MGRLWRWLFAWTPPAEMEETFETTHPWVVYTYFVPRWATLVLGRSSVRCECCICGTTHFPTLRIPRWGPVEGRGHHPARTHFIRAHEHPNERRYPLQWALPLRNMAALQSGDLEEILGVVVERARRATPE